MTLESVAAMLMRGGGWFVSMDGASVLSLREYCHLSAAEADRYVPRPFIQLDSANLYASCIRDLRKLHAMT